MTVDVSTEQNVPIAANSCCRQHCGGEIAIADGSVLVTVVGGTEQTVPITANCAAVMFAGVTVIA